MVGYNSDSVSGADDKTGLPQALGVIWSPPPARRRRISLKALLPATRRAGGAHRRSRHVSEQSGPAILAAVVPS